MANMFDPDAPGDGEVTPEGKTYGGHKFGGQTYGGQKFGGQTHGGQKFGGWKPGDPDPNRDPGETGGQPDVAIDTDRTYGGNRFGGNKYGGNKFGGQKFGGWKPGDPDPNRDPGETGGQPDVPLPPGRSPYGNRRFGGNTFGGNKFGGNTYGGNTFGGNTFGESSRRDPGETGGQPEIGRDRTGGAATLPDAPMPYLPVRPEMHDESQGEGQKITDEPGIKSHQDEADFLPGKRPVTPPGKGGGTAGGGGGAKGGGGGGKGGRKALGDQTRTEAYDPTLDRADPRNVAMVDEQYRVNPKQWERAQKGAIDPTKPGERTGEAAAKFTNHYTNALVGATKYMEDTFHQKKGDPNQGEGYNAMTFKAVGAPDPETVNQVFKVVDPNNQLEPKERMELATRAMHDWYTARGDTKNADKVAAEMLQHGNKQAQALGNQALQAVKAGNRQGAIDAISKAYDWLPDGFHADVKDNKLTITNDKGQTVNSIPLDDKMVSNLATGLATGTLYWDVVQQRAGKPGTFAPPTAQPTSAVATTAPTAPTGGASPAPGPAAPPGASPARPAPAAPATAAAPAAAPATAPPTAAAPAAAPPPAPPPGVSAPPPAGTPAPPPAAAPASPPVGPPVPPPQVTRPAAPAPAAPGPAPTQQAAVPPAPAPAPPTQAVTPAVPPPLQGPVQPTTTKRPVVEGEPTPAPPPAAATPPVQGPPPSTPAQGSGGPSGSPAGQPSQPAQPKQPEPVWNKDDPDTVPTISGKPNIVRRSTYPMPDDVKVARQGMAQAEAEYRRQQDWLAHKQKTTKGTDAYQRTLVQLRDDVEKTYKTKTERYKDTIREHQRLEREHDAQEKKDLTPRHLQGAELDRAERIASEHFANYVKAGDKSPGFANNALRLYDTPEKQVPLIDAVSKIQAINPNVSTKKIAEMVTTAVTHVGNDDKAKGETMNDQVGEKGSRFLVVGEDLARNPVIAIGHGNSRVLLHVPRDTLNDIKRLKTESYKDAAKKIKDEKDKPKTDYSKYMPGQLQQTITDVKETVKGAQEKQKAEGREMKPDAPINEEGKTTQQIQEEQRRRRREAERKSSLGNVEP